MVHLLVAGFAILAYKIFVYLNENRDFKIIGLMNKGLGPSKYISYNGRIYISGRHLSNIYRKKFNKKSLLV